MTRTFIILLTLFFSLSGPAMGGYSDFGRSSNAANARGSATVVLRGNVSSASVFSRIEAPILNARSVGMQFY